MKKSPSHAEDREENNLLAGDGEGREGGRSQGLAPVQNEDKWAVSSGEYILSLPHLPLHQGPTQACQARAELLCLCPLRSHCHGDGAISHVCCCCTEAL